MFCRLWMYIFPFSPPMQLINIQPPAATSASPLSPVVKKHHLMSMSDSPCSCFPTHPHFYCTYLLLLPCSGLKKQDITAFLLVSHPLAWRNACTLCIDQQEMSSRMRLQVQWGSKPQLSVFSAVQCAKALLAPSETLVCKKCNFTVLWWILRMLLGQWRRCKPLETR